MSYPGNTPCRHRFRRPWQALSSAQQIEERIAAQAMQPMGRTPITVTNADVEDVTVTLTTAVTLPGKVAVEGQSLSTLTGIDRIRVTLRTAQDGLPDAGVAAACAWSRRRRRSFPDRGVREGEFIAVGPCPVAWFLRQEHSIWRLRHPEQLV